MSRKPDLASRPWLASRSHGAGGDWRAALWLGLITSTFSTVVAQLLAGRFGREAAVDWMVVASIPLQNAALQTTPSWPVILAGILFHQSADIAWALVFFGLFRRWTARLTPATLLLAGPPWALLTSAIEYFVIVPVWQPVFVLEQPYWIGFLVHFTSALLYPLYPWLRDRAARLTPSPHRRFAAGWSGLAAAGVAAVAVLAWLGARDREWPSHSAEAAWDRAYMRRMAAHHAQGVAVAWLAAEQASAPSLRALARLMVAAQTSDIAVFARWWHSWFEAPVLPSAEEDAAMPGMLSQAQITSLENALGTPGFDALFVTLMTEHHRGAIVMAGEAMRHAGDPRLRVMAHAVRHAQRGEIELMRGIARGPAVVRAAVSALLAPAGKGRAEREDASPENRPR